MMMIVGAASGSSNGSGGGAVLDGLPSLDAAEAPGAATKEDNDENERVAAFLEWLRANGARFDRIRWPAYDTASSSRGAVATADISPGESLLELPERLLLTPAAALDAPAPLGPALEECAGAMTDEELLAVYLMHELRQGPASFYHPYLAILPQPDDLGALSCLAWTDAEIGACQDPWLVAEVQRRRQGMEDAYARVVEGGLRARFPEVFAGDAFAFGAFEYAMLIVQSRAFGRRLPFPSLVPLADLLNHANVPIMYNLDVTTDRQQKLEQQQEGGQQRVFRLYHPTGAQGVARGAEVFNSYGRRGNRHFLLHYGFALEGNEWEVVEVTAPPIPKGAAALQAAILALGERAGQVFQIAHALTAGAFNWDLLCYARALAAAASEDHGLEGQIDLTRPLSLAYEQATLRRLRALLVGALATFPTTLEEDEEALVGLEGRGSAGVSPHRLRAALTYRVTRKRILHTHLRAIEGLLGVVEKGGKVQEGQVLGVFEEDGEMRAYVDCMKALNLDRVGARVLNVDTCVCI